VLELEEALNEILPAFAPLPPELIPLSTAADRFVAEDIRAPIHLPLFDNSAMDGYAVRSSDIANASREKAVVLELLGRVAAGEVFKGQLREGTCVRLFTGSPLPPGADAVVMQEDTQVALEKPGLVLVLDSARPWENIRLQGEDVKQGSVVARTGERITAARVALLAALGLHQLRVARQPMVGLLATGTELLEAGQPLGPGRIYESNRITLAHLLTSVGALPRIYPLVPDALATTEEALRRALVECDAVITSGGVSVGELDFVKAAWENLDGSMAFWKVAIRPGKPFVFGKWREKFLFGLPGNPVSAFVTFLLLVRPALLRWQGAANLQLPSHRCVLVEPLVNRGDRRHFMRVTVNEQGEARLAGAQASHMLSGLAEANGLVEVPPASELRAGTTVPVMRIEV
jgi:molybdopterin molybdotransferase